MAETSDQPEKKRLVRIPLPNPEPPLPILEIARGMRLAHQNAISLLEDAEILFEKARYPRCVSLCVLAQEEASKIPQICGLLYEKDSKGQKISLAQFKKCFKSHHHKTVEFMTMHIMNDVLRHGGQHIRKNAADSGDALGTLNFNAVKERGFYLHFDSASKKFFTPKEAIGGDLAKDCLEHLKNYLMIYAPLAGQSDAELAQSLTAMLRKLEDGGFRKEREQEVRKIWAHLPAQA
jgi:AbiV family abortive infection protein